MLEVREAMQQDLFGIMELYTHLNSNPFLQIDDRIKDIWNEILNDKNRHTLVVCDLGKIAVSVTLFINKSLVKNQRPFALVEYVVTHPEYRGNGLAKRLMAEAQQIAEQNNCYKIMLITGQSDETVHRLYQKAGYKSQGKTAYVKELEERLI